VFEALAGRVAVLEGATPYLRPTILRPIVQLFLQTRAFFHDPSGNVDLLSRLQIDHVVVLRAGGVGYRSVIGRTEEQALDELPALERLFRNQSMTVYRVVGSGPHTGVPDPGRYPGYDCGLTVPRGRT
jgi:hypothetical protein